MLLPTSRLWNDDDEGSEKYPLTCGKADHVDHSFEQTPLRQGAVLGV